MMEDVLKGLNSALQSISGLRNELLKDLTPEERIKYNQFEVDCAKLMKDGDLVGLEKLKSDFNKKMK